MTVPRRPRDAEKTRQTLLSVARRRFAEDGYAATTVRDIADEAGVNVALISRYFASKEGLFEECLRLAGDEFRRTAGDATLDQVPQRIAREVTGPNGGTLPSELVLLLRSSGDENADRIRRAALRTSSERLAALSGWTPEHPDSERLLLRAQVALATAVGITVLRSMTGLEPLASAQEPDLIEPLHALITALL